MTNRFSNFTFKKTTRGVNVKPEQLTDHDNFLISNSTKAFAHLKPNKIISLGLPVTSLQLTHLPMTLLQLTLQSNMKRIYSLQKYALRLVSGLSKDVEKQIFI